MVEILQKNILERMVHEKAWEYLTDWLVSIHSNLHETAMFYLNSIRYADIQDLLSPSNLFSMAKTLLANTHTPNSVFLVILFLISCLIFMRGYIFFRARNCSVSYDWGAEGIPRAGQDARMRISIFRTGESFQLYPVPDPEPLITLLDSVTVTVQQEGTKVVAELGVDDSTQEIVAKFFIEKAGPYKIFCRYKGIDMSGSPFNVTFLSNETDITKTDIDWKNPIVLVLGTPVKHSFVFRDKCGNPCTTTADNLLRLTYEALMPRQGFYTNATDAGIKLNFNVTADPINKLKVVDVHMKSGQVGWYTLKILHNRVPLTSGTFQLLSISSAEELSLLDKEYSEKETLFCPSFAAKLIKTSSETSLSPPPIKRGVMVELSCRFIFIQEAIYDEYLVTRLATLKVAENTKITLVYAFEVEGIERNTLRIEDKDQQQVVILEMKAEDARLFAILYARLLRSEGQCLSFDRKRAKLYRELQSTDGDRATLPKVLQIRRNEIVQTTLDVTQYFSREDWARPFMVSFFGEPVKANGRDWIEWAEILLGIFFENNAHGLFHSIGTSKFVHPNSCKSSRWTRKHYELAGKIVGKYIVETALDESGHNEYFADARFTRTFLRELLSLEIYVEHLEMDDPLFFTATVEPILKQDVSQLNLTFVRPVYDPCGNLIEMNWSENPEMVTNENKVEYINYLAHSKLIEKVKGDIKAFMEGINCLIHPNLLRSFDENELELLICGSSGYSGCTLKELKAHYVYMVTDNDLDHTMAKVKDWFWKCMTDLSPMDFGRFLQFVTGSSRLPPGGLVELRPKLSMTVSYLQGQRPIANKLMHRITLSDNQSYEDFAKCFVAAIRG